MRKQTNGKMKKIKYILGCIGTALMFSACSDFLDVATQNGLDPDQAMMLKDFVMPLTLH